MNWKMIVAGALGGFLAAVAVDIHAWSKTEGDYDWGLAVKRWVAGAVAGAAGALGFGGVQ